MSNLTQSSERYVVYRIRCLVNGKCYVGSTQDAVDRSNNHWGLLRRGKHHSIKLQRAWNKYGESKFDFDLCEYGLTAREAREAESNWIKRLDSFYNGYNMTDYTGQGTRIPASQRKRMSEAAKEVGARIEVRQGRSLRARIQHIEGRIRYRTPATAKTKICIRCGNEFNLSRNPKTGAWRENKLCGDCALSCRFSTRK